MTAASAPKSASATLGEFAQAKIRCWMNFALITLALVAYRRDPSLSLATVWYTFFFTVLSALTLLVWARQISHGPPNSPARIAQRIASIALDNIAISWILFFGGETLAGVFCVYIWISIGYGMRFGRRYLFANLVASIIGFTIVATSSPFWQEYSFLSFSFGAGLVVITLYTAYLITQLHAAVRRAESASRAKSDFLAKMSHELRTPLHGIIALADLLSGTHSASQKQEMLRQISVSSNTLLDLINRILDISKYQSGTFKLQPAPMNLHEVIDDALSVLAPQARAKGIQLSAFCDAAVENWLIGSPRQLQEIIINLAGNALKFTDQGQVRIAVVRTGGDDERTSLRLTISDTGPGIPPEYLNHIFDPFSQADDSITRMHGGSGLGTTIARDLVRLMDGDISAESTVGVGTTMTINLSLAHALVPPDQPLARLRVGVLGVPPAVPDEVLDKLGLTDVEHAPDFVPDDAACIFIPIAASDLLAQLNDSSPPGIGVGAANCRSKAVAHSHLVSYVEDPSDAAQVRRALGFVLLARSRAVVDVVDASLDNGRSVLIAEDNLTNQMIARIALERAGYRCTIVDDGEKALDELSTGAYDIALIDMHMPRMDGLELARLYNFATFDAPMRTPIVMLTADNRPEAVADADLAGIARFLVKPIKPSALLRVVQDVLLGAHDGPPTAACEPSASVITMTQREAEPLDLDGVVFGELLDFMEPAEARQFFAEFREDTLRYLATLRDVEAGHASMTKLRDDMHALSGAARIVGAMRLAALARRIEYGEESDIRGRASVWRTELERAISVCTRLIEQRLSAAA